MQILSYICFSSLPFPLRSIRPSRYLGLPRLGKPTPDYSYVVTHRIVFPYKGAVLIAANHAK